MTTLLQIWVRQRVFMPIQNLVWRYPGLVVFADGANPPVPISPVGDGRSSVGGGVYPNFVAPSSHPIKFTIQTTESASKLPVVHTATSTSPKT